MIINVFCSLYAAKTNDRYIMRPYENGQLYFILPFEIPSQSPKEKALEADITYPTASDSVTMNMSVKSMIELSVDSFVFEGNHRVVIRDYEPFFVEPEGKLWLHRFSLRFPLNDLMQLFRGGAPLKIVVCTQKDKIEYGWTEKEWKKEQEWMNKILHIIDNNRKILN